MSNHNIPSFGRCARACANRSTLIIALQRKMAWLVAGLLLLSGSAWGQGNGMGRPLADPDHRQVPAVSAEVETPQRYVEVEISFAGQEEMEDFLQLELDYDHFHPSLGANQVVLPAQDLEKLRAAGVPYRVVVEDVAAAVDRRNKEYLAKNPIVAPEKSTAGFELGSMGGFYTYAEVLQQLDEMRTLYPNLITERFSIGTSIEGRTIWAVKISDNPSTDESAAEAPVYFDALHHSREPASMATVINFMFHLLENYSSDPGIGYIVNNREIFVVPVVNPDGYEYNRQTNPNGGGMWRKNRRVNSGSSCRGVDLNRNYNTDWGGAGSSSNPCSDSYRGASVFSEPESRAIRDFTTSINAPIAYTTHTSGGYWLGPDFSNGQTEFAIHAELNSDCMHENEYIYGDAAILLGYASGTTQNWMYEALGSLSWTPEIGTTGFWPTIPEIIPLVNQQIKPYEYACWVAGALADYQGFEVLNAEGLSVGQPLSLGVRIKNKGLSKTAQNVVVSLTPDNPGVTVVAGSQAYGNIASRAFASNASPFTFTVDPSVPVGTVVTFQVVVSQEGVVSDQDQFRITVGQPTVLFSDDAENGNAAWVNGGTGTNWQASTEDAYTGNACFVDSPLGHSASNNNRSFTLAAPISLVGVSNPRLEFAAKWGLHTTTDYVRLQISTNGGSTWTNLSSAAMESIGGAPAFVRNERWTHQVVDLSAYSGQSIRLRFLSVANSSLRSDGFYFDDFRVVGYAGINPATCTDGIQNGDETGVDCGGSACSPCPTCTDGIQNGDETGVDCGGPACPACPSCNDGILNNGETSVDCGGPNCAACPTCTDGIQNGDETGVDCGGACTPCETGCATVVILTDGFETGYGNWIDGGTDCNRVSSSTYASTGVFSVALRDNTSSSVMSTNNLNLAGYGEITVNFSYYPVSMDNSSEDFWLQISTNGGSSYTTVEEWNLGDEFQNNTRYFESVVLSGPFTTNTRLRFRCDASADNDLVYLDDIVVTACQPGTSAPTCSDGIQNGSETGIDCGGPDCPACPSCSDGIQNGGETGVDCGGPNCVACPSCNDGILNNGETAVDCGGPNCSACPSCSDGIQNGGETGVDCGGPNCAACPVTYCTSSSSSTQYEYIQSVSIGGTSNTSGNNGGYGNFTASPILPLNAGTTNITLVPGFQGGAYNEAWSVYIDYNADGDFTDAGELVFQGISSTTINGSFVVPGGLSGVSRLRVQMQYSNYTSGSCAAYSWGEVEDYTVNFGSGARRNAPVLPAVVQTEGETLSLFPNPATTDLFIRTGNLSSQEPANWQITNAAGQAVRAGIAQKDQTDRGFTLDISALTPGMYYFTVVTSDKNITRRFVVQRR
ncbi:M14 family zinc carboxypeptidase [Neolewinella lacunae]|uniref:carboxypeptidase T n=1 Tax=Neolewinella lacunae TaxID=1517758 RepID=A0A923T701_9BACT|nr:M14 family zinc carboxypeptidase [Neolewinella lacunae]MBC6993970.1 T9SS type A sorting domain-containing protein [Neolewinella lacunae]MDN3635515.1 M14 family zinc carboxypeptidase [Neolewinella lacunae]